MAMSKTASAEKTAGTALKRRRREAKEIAKWEREKARPRGKYYLWYLLFIITIVYIVDEISTQIGTQMKTEMANDLFSSFGDKSVMITEIVGYLSYASIAFALFYKPFADKFGRKLFLIINTFGMSIGMFVMFLADNVVLYVVSSAIIAFFIPHDMQVVYIMEAAPSKHRAKIYSVIKSAATLGVMLIPLFRNILMTDVTKWRLVFLVPAVMGAAVSAIALFFARETDSFIEHRLKYLRMTDEQREQEKKNKELENAQGGLGNALRFAWSHTQTKWLFITGALNGFGFLITTQYQVVLTYGYAKQFESAAVTLDDALNSAAIGPVTTALFMFPIASAAVQLISGFFADKLGRKPASVLMTLCTIVSFILFFAGTRLLWPPVLVGLFCGATVGSYWATGDITGGMMLSESSPTNLRASILSARTIAMAVGMGGAFIGGMLMLNKFGNSFAGPSAMIFAVPGMAASLIALLVKVKETKDIDLNTVRGDEWDNK